MSKSQSNVMELQEFELRRAFGDRSYWTEAPLGAGESTTAHPGTQDKIEVMIRRYAAGRPIHVDGDKTAFGDGRDTDNREHY